MEKLDLTGRRFGKLVCKEKYQHPKWNVAMWICECDCGEKTHSQQSKLLRIKHGTKNCRKCITPQKKGNLNGSWRGFGNISRRYWNIAIKGAIKRNLEFTISIEYGWDLFLKQESKCALSGRNICFYENVKEISLQTASLDRIDSLKGYVEGNVQWIHKDINWMKNDFNQKYFLEVCKDIYLTNYKNTDDIPRYLLGAMEDDKINDG